MGGPLSAGLTHAAVLSVIPVPGIPEVVAGDNLGRLIWEALTGAGLKLDDGDILIVASKVVSKAEGRRVEDLPVAGPRAGLLADETGFDPRLVELILSETREVLRARPRVLVVETVHGLVCANGGVDRSNTGHPGSALLLPQDPDGSARALRDDLARRSGRQVAVLVSDTFGRPFRHGQVNVAVGVAGMDAVRDYRGQADPDSHVLEGTEIAVADELCAAAELVMNKLDRIPAAIVRGYAWEPAAGGLRPLLRDPAQDYFR